MNKESCIIMGSGGHASVLVEAIRMSAAYAIQGYTVKMKPDHADQWAGLTLLGDDECIPQYDPLRVRLVNGVGSTGSSTIRTRLFDEWKAKGYRFASIVHPTAYISTSAQLGEGIQVMAGAVIQTGVTIEHNTIVNTRAVVEHHCEIGAHSHIAPGAVVCGNVHIGSGVHIGAGAVIKQGLRIGDCAVIGAGAVVIRDVPAHQTVVGVPARGIRS